MAHLASLWIGDSLGFIEQASARSFLAQGDQLTIYSYDEVKNIPEGVINKDARSILDTPTIIRHKKTGSPALHSDLFRFALMQRSDEIWVDLDIIALRPLDFPTPYVFAYETPGVVNGAILRLPKTSAALQELLKYDINYKGVPFHLTGWKKTKYEIRSFLTGGMSIDKWPWGSLGPLALTHFLKKTGEIEHALPISAFYAISFLDVERFVIPGAITPSDIPEDAWAVHLWGKELRKIINEKYSKKIPQESFLKKYL